jgi:site-specific DNA-methyltransferase (adenine-specific)
MRMENQIVQGDCLEVLPQLPRESVDLVVTDPPYGVRYTDRYGRTVANDDDLGPVHRSFAELYRVLKQDTFCISFYGWKRVDAFFKSWRSAGFYPVGHIVWAKNYASSRTFLQNRHEQAYLLAKGRPAKPSQPISDVQPWEYTGNRVHPTQKAPSILQPLIESFSQRGDLVLDPFSGSGSCALAAAQCGRRFLGIELEARYCQYARECLSQYVEHAAPQGAFAEALSSFVWMMEKQGVALPSDFRERVRREWHSNRSH